MRESSNIASHANNVADVKATTCLYLLRYAHTTSFLLFIGDMYVRLSSLTQRRSAWQCNPFTVVRLESLTYSIVNTCPVTAAMTEVLNFACTDRRPA